MSDDTKSGLLILFITSMVALLAIMVGHTFGESSVLEKLAKDKKVCEEHYLNDGTKFEKCFVVVDEYIVKK